MNDRGRLGALLFALALIAVGVIAFEVEGSLQGDEERPDGVGVGVRWSHELHARHPDYSCQSCHHKSSPGQSQMKSCGECHPASPDLGQRPTEPSKAGDRRAALHGSCVGCHQAASQGPTECAGCHERPATSTTECARCHRPSFEQLSSGEHAQVACASCHSELEDNLEGDEHPRPVPRAATQQQCLACHGDQPADAAGFPNHRFADCPARGRLDDAGPRACLSCHAAHNPDPARRPPPPRR